VSGVSHWYESAPVPPSDQDWYVNGVAIVESAADPETLLATLHEIEGAVGRRRHIRNEARVLDLDLLAVGRRVQSTPGRLVLPHPRLAERAFVLLPLRDIVPDWRHPLTGETVDEMIAALPPDPVVRRLPA